MANNEETEWGTKTFQWKQDTKAKRNKKRSNSSQKYQGFFADDFIFDEVKQVDRPGVNDADYPLRNIILDSVTEIRKLETLHSIKSSTLWHS